MDNNNSHYTLTDSAVLMAACVVSGMGALVFNAFPLFLSSIANEFAMNDAQLGNLGMYYLLGFAAITLFAPLWMARIEWRSVGVAAMAIVLIALVVQLFTTDENAIYLSTGGIGVGSGVVFTIGLSILGRALDPERAFGIKLMYEMTFAGVLVYAMTAFVIAEFGFNGFIAGAAVMYGTALIFCFRLPDNFMKREAAQVGENDSHSLDRKLPAWVAIFALFIQFAAFSAIWGFMERIGVDNALGPTTVGTILSLSILAGFGGALLAAILGNKHGHTMPLVVGLMLTVIAILVLINLNGLTAFIIAACTVNGMLQFTIVYQMGLIAHNDYSGKIAVMIPFILSFSGAMGPGIAGEIVETSGFTPVYTGFVSITIVTIATSIWVGRQRISAQTENLKYV